MATVDQLLAELDRRGVHLAVTGSKLRATAPRAEITPELTAAIRDHKPALVLEVLARQVVLPGTTSHTWRRCTACGHPMLLDRDRPCAMTPGCTGRHTTTHPPTKHGRTQ